MFALLDIEQLAGVDIVGTGLYHFLVNKLLSRKL